MRNMKRIVKQGAPHYVAPWYKTLSPAAKRGIGDEAKPLFRTTARERMTANALAYAKAMLAHRGQALPNGDCKPAVIFADCGDELRARAVVWQKHEYNRRTYEHDYIEVLRFDIPHWDHVPTVRVMSQASYAIAAE